MKVFFLLSVIMFNSVNCSAQKTKFEDIPKELILKLTEMGLDNSILLNSIESQYFNFIFKDLDYNFTNKRVGFVYSQRKTDKSEYFKLEKERYKLNLTPNQGTVYILNQKEITESGGYDVIIVFWSKKKFDKNKLIKKFKK